MLCQLSYTRLLRLGLVAQLAEHWTSIPKVAGSIPTVVRLTFQPARCGYALRVTSKTLYSPEYITPKHTQKYHANNLFDLISIAFGTLKSFDVRHRTGFIEYRRLLSQQKKKKSRKMLYIWFFKVFEDAARDTKTRDL